MRRDKKTRYMTIQTAIKKAIEGGYKHPPRIKYENAEMALTLLDRAFWQALGKAKGWEGRKIRMCCGCGIALRWNEKPTMDGKHGGKCGSDIIEYEGQWLIEMHRLIDALAQGKTVEQFFETL